MNLFTGMIQSEPAEKYHERKEYISSSPLPEIAKSPLHFYEAWTGEVEKSSDPMDRGTFIHSIVLEQDINKFAARPLNEKGELVRSNSKEYAEFLAANVGKTPIHPELYNEAMRVLNSCCANSTFLRAYERSQKEVSFYAKHAATGIFIKARPDMVALDRSFILDVKSTSDMAMFQKQIFRLGYDVRLVHYAETIKALEGVEIQDYYFMAVESKAPYASQIFRLSKSAVETAQMIWGEWMNEISVCMKEGNWPGLADKIIDVERPSYLEPEMISFEGVG